MYTCTIHVYICFSNYSYQAAAGLLIDACDKLWPHNLLLCISRCKFHSNNSFSHVNKSVCRKKPCQPSAVVKNVESQSFHSFFFNPMNKMLSSLLVQTSECQGLSYLFICPYSSACVLNSMTGGWSRISSLLSTGSFVKPDPNNTNRLFRA